MELPNKLIEDVRKQEVKEEAIFNKIKSTVMYKRRKLDKDVRHYISNQGELGGPINSEQIDTIGRQHGFHVGATQFREDKLSS